MKRNFWQLLLIVIIIFVIFFTGLALVYLQKNEVRTVSIEKSNPGGIIEMHGEKLKVNGTTVSANFPVQIRNAADFLLLSDDSKPGFLSGLIQIVTLGLCIYYLWYVNLNDPFDYRTYTAVKFIGIAYICRLLVIHAGQLYTYEVLIHRYQNLSDFQYKPGDWSFIKIIIVISIINFYRIATYNQQQQELTV